MTTDGIAVGVEELSRTFGSKRAVDGVRFEIE